MKPNDLPLTSQAPVNPAPVLELIQAFRRSKVMFTAVSLGIFDVLNAQPTDVSAIAQKLTLNIDALQRLLDGCVALELLSVENGRYANTPLSSRFLTRFSPQTLAGYILYSDRALYALWGNLEPAIREGSNRWKQTFGPGASLFDQFFRTDEARGDFLSGMNGFGQISSPAVIAAFDLSRFHHAVDVGGGTGHLVLEARAQYPLLEISVFDLPRTNSFRPFSENNGEHRSEMQVIEGDFFRDPLPSADLYMLGRVLHDWSEEKVRFLLKKVYDRLPPGGGVLIAEKFLDDNKSAPIGAVLQSLNMLVCTEGKERTLAEYTALLREAGFSQIEGKVTASPLDAILALKK